VFSAEASADSTAFSSSSNNLSSRVKTSANVEWITDNSFPTSGEVITTPDISAVIQEVVDLSAWCGGKDLNILIEGTSSDTASAREARASDVGKVGSSTSCFLRRFNCHRLYTRGGDLPSCQFKRQFRLVRSDPINKGVEIMKEFFRYFGFT
jgi:hypothetical protein